MRAALLLAVALAGCTGTAGTCLDCEESAGSDTAADTGKRDPGHPNALALWTTTFWCSATVVAPNTMLTAAHCLQDPVVFGDRKFVMIEVGDSVLHAPGADYGGVDRAGFVYASHWVIHPSYDPKKTHDDIAILKLDQPIDGIAPAVLDSRPLSYDEPITIVGFGYGLKTSDDSGAPGEKRVTTNLVADIFKTDFGFSYVENQQGTTCHGDSGGPTYHEGVVETLVGQHESIAGDVCGESSIDMRIDYYLPWYACNSDDPLSQYKDGQVQPLVCSTR